MADSFSLDVMPRLRRAWLQEIGIETMWPGPSVKTPPGASALSGSTPIKPAVADAMSPAERTAAEPASQAAHVAPVLQDLQAPIPAAKSESAPAPALSVPAVPAHVAEPSPADGAPAPSQAVASAAPVAPGLLLRTYADVAGKRRWLVVVDANDFWGPQAGPSVFLQSLMRAMQLQPEAEVALPADVDTSTALARHVPPGAGAPGAVLVLGRAARRALLLRERIGSIGQRDLGQGPVPAMALPAASDITAGAAGKAYVWRALWALADAAAG